MEHRATMSHSTAELVAYIQVETEAVEVMDVARHAGDRVFEIISTHACTMRTVSAAIAVGLLAAHQVVEETIVFAVKSMDGDEADEDAMQAAARQLALSLICSEADARLEHLERALDLARNRLRAAAVNEAPKQSREYYDYSQWADEADRALTQSGNASTHERCTVGSCKRHGKCMYLNHPRCPNAPSYPDGRPPVATKSA